MNSLIIVFSIIAYVNAVSYDGDELITAYPTARRHLAVLKDLGKQEGLLEFWKPKSLEGLQILNIPVDIRIPKQHRASVKNLLRKSDLKYKVKIENLQHLIDNQFDSKGRQNKQDSYNYAQYHSAEEIIDWTQDIADAYPTLAVRNVLATSFEGSDIPSLVIGTNTTSRKVLLDCGEHAREWMSSAACQCFVGKMLSEYGTDQTVTDMMDRISWTVVPLMNPDGYNYSWFSDRNWIKTRSNYENNACLGVNVNTNFDSNYGGPGSSINSCSDYYRGPEVKSESEVAALSDLMETGEYDMYVTYHAYEQSILYPYFYNQAPPDNSKTLREYSINAAKRMFLKNATIYNVMPGYMDGVGLRSGRSVDYAYESGIPLAYQIELPDNSEYGYFPPESRIMIPCSEAFAAMTSFAEDLFPEP